LHLVLEDETTGNGSLLCLEAGHGGDAAVILDGTRPDRAIVAHAGNLEVRITVRGVPASVSVSHLGVNAADELAALHERLRTRVHELNDQRLERWTQFPSPYQFVTQSLHADGRALTVPEVARSSAWLTFPPPHNANEMRSLLQEEAQRFGQERELPAPPELEFRGFC